MARHVHVSTVSVNVCIFDFVVQFMALFWAPVPRGMTPSQQAGWRIGAADRITNWLTDAAAHRANRWDRQTDRQMGLTDGWTDKALTNCIFYWCCICWIGRQYLSFSFLLYVFFFVCLSISFMPAFRLHWKSFAWGPWSQ